MATQRIEGGYQFLYLSRAELQTLLSLIEKDCTALGKLIKSLQKDTSLPIAAPDVYREFFSELARNSPACGIFQYCGNPEIIEILQNIANCKLDLFDSINHSQLDLLTRYIPILTSFLHMCHRPQNIVPAPVRAVIMDIVDCMIYPSTIPQPSSDHYHPPEENKLSFFPNLPSLTGPANYAADKLQAKCGSDECRKYTGCHPVLTPGVFTIFCPHKICYGFEVMSTHESPRHPFQIFRSRFKVAPKLIIYDNACKLHQYCLNREPAFFKCTQFAVDRFHWRGHVGCSAGYCLNKYESAEVERINSQVNEQANAGLQHIKAQLSYMSAENFIFNLSLFLSIKNIDARKKLDITK